MTTTANPCPQYHFARVHPTGAVMGELVKAGFKVLAYTEWQTDQDGEIDLSTRVHVQVGLDYFGVVVSNPDGTSLFYESQYTLGDLFADIRTAMRSVA